VPGCTLNDLETRVKKNSWFALVAFATGTAAAATPSTDSTQSTEGYVCSISRVSSTDYQPAILTFTLTTEPECDGGWYTYYVCGSEPPSGASLGLCAQSAAFSMAEQAMIHDELLHAAQRNLPVDVTSGPCLDARNGACFERATVYNMPARNVGRSGPKPRLGAK
jgi:hypothetical protein